VAFVTETQYVSREVRTEFLYIRQREREAISTKLKEDIIYTFKPINISDVMRGDEIR
jgi:hypothetical protein